ncbi:MAG: hypothetical protein PQJ49_10955 [Sphaerochaetaceae bacterium]|nr:hypothetical protein [Sphaerochaetaceae bacterium]
MKYLFLLAIPLNFIGFVIKYKSKIPNYLIAIVLTIISFFVTGFYAKFFVTTNSDEIIKFTLIHSILITSVATYGWDSAFGINAFISEIMGIYRDIKTQLTLEVSMEKRIKEYRKNLLKKGLTVSFTDLLMVLICVSIKASIPEIVDYVIYTTLIAISTVLIEDITNKALTDKDKLNIQYFIVFVFAFASIGALSVAYFSLNWTVFTTSLIVAGVFLFLTFFLGHFSYVPSLRSKDEVTQDLQKQKWKMYKKMEDDEIIEDMINTIKYYFKKDLWGADLNLGNPMFLDAKGIPQTAKGASFARGNNTPIDDMVPYFKKIIASKDSVLAEKKR